MTLTKFLIGVIGLIFFTVTLCIWILLFISTIALMAELKDAAVTANDVAFYVLLLVFRKPMEWLTKTFVEQNRDVFGPNKSAEFEVQQNINIQIL